MKNDDFETLTFTVVSPDSAKLPEYPYVWVTNDGAVHELDSDDRSYLETPFHPCDGARPYTKNQYTGRDGWGEMGGYCLRSAIPSDIPIIQEPVHRDPPKPMIEMIREYTERAGWTLIENPDGSYTAAKPKTKQWWQFWK